MAAALNAGLPIGPSMEIRIVLEAALGWLAENPVVPTQEQLQAMREHLLPDMPKGAEHFTSDDLRQGAVEWQRRMFLAPPEPVTGFADLLGGGEESDRRVIEAWNRAKRLYSAEGQGQGVAAKVAEVAEPVKPDAVPDALVDLWDFTKSSNLGEQTESTKFHNSQLLEAYRRGREGE
jgi:hypothetical protein